LGAFRQASAKPRDKAEISAGGETRQSRNNNGAKVARFRRHTPHAWAPSVSVQAGLHALVVEPRHQALMGREPAVVFAAGDPQPFELRVERRVGRGKLLVEIVGQAAAAEGCEGSTILAPSRETQYEYRLGGSAGLG